MRYLQVRLQKLSLMSLISSLSLTLSLFPSTVYYPSVRPPPISGAVSSARASRHRSGTQPAKNGTPGQDLGRSRPDLGSCLFVCGFEILCVNLICEVLGEVCEVLGVSEAFLAFPTSRMSFGAFGLFTAKIDLLFGLFDV